jgi:MarR family transcriptional regulator, temperature-dependent positive regulator of motility
LNISTIEDFFHIAMHAPLQLKTDYINVLLDMATERTRDRGSRVYEIETGLSLRDIRLLRAIGGSPGITMGQLVQACAIEKTLVSKLISALVQRQLVRRQIGSEDARQIHMYLTQAGIDLVLQAEPIGQEMEARFLDCLSASEVDTLRRILHKIIDAEAGSRDIFEFLLAQLRESKSSNSSTPPSGTPRKK